MTYYGYAIERTWIANGVTLYTCQFYGTTLGWAR